MKLEGEKLVLGKKLTDLDQKVLDFTEKLESLDVKYVVVSGYVAILTGRSRGTEDVDLLLDPATFDNSKFGKLIDSGYWSVDATKREEAEDRLEDDLSIRLAEDGETVPNFEIFYPSTSWDRDCIEQRVRVEMGEEVLYISPIELQIAYKLYLGSQKDFEDALHLFTVFREDIDEGKLEKIAGEMSVHGELERLGET
ncbi:MAG: hypothetical protein ABEJ56_03570 [Candidatus Nanohaloarchaea archaeon]